METQALLVLILAAGQGLYVPMPSWDICQEALVQARNEFLPYLRADSGHMDA
jgi:hypothetical protein